MKQEEKTLRWLETQRDKIDQDIMHYVRLIKDVRYEQAATASLKDLSSQKTACIDCITAVKYMYKVIREADEKDVDSGVTIAYNEDGAFKFQISEKKYTVKGVNDDNL